MASKTLDGPSTNSEINDAAVSDEIVDTNDDVDTYDPDNSLYEEESVTSAEAVSDELPPAQPTLIPISNSGGEFFDGVHVDDRNAISGLNVTVKAGPLAEEATEAAGSAESDLSVTHRIEPENRSHPLCVSLSRWQSLCASHNQLLPLSSLEVTEEITSSMRSVGRRSTTLVPTTIRVLMIRLRRVIQPSMPPQAPTISLVASGPVLALL